MKKVDPRFSKFVKTKSNAAIKEGFKQEKRKYKKERAEFFEKKKQEAALQKTEAPKIARPKVDLAQVPLNKYLAHGGVCSRRDAAELIKEGKVKVNGKVVSEPGYKMSEGDEVTANGKKVVITKNLVYILLNKPKDYITTTDDPQKRKTVLDIVQKATPERVYPVGRLDRNTSGVLLITNDGELAQKLTHPSSEVKKIYAVTLDKPLDKSDFDSIVKGITLEDGPVKVDVLAYSDMKDRTQVGVEIHSGRNRIVRRIFESLGYDVKNLDRVMFAGLTKKNVERGKFRFLNEKEVRNLKYLGKDAKSKPKAGNGGKAKSKVAAQFSETKNSDFVTENPSLADKPLRKRTFQKKDTEVNFKPKSGRGGKKFESADKRGGFQSKPATSQDGKRSFQKKDGEPSFKPRTGGVDRKFESTDKRSGFKSKPSVSKEGRSGFQKSDKPTSFKSKNFRTDRNEPHSGKTRTSFNRKENKR